MKHKDFEDCLKKGKISKFAGARKLSGREWTTAQEDLSAAQDSLKQDNSKWATVQAYYAMFHTARALLYSKGYREKSHYCLIAAMKALFVQEGLLDVTLVEAFQTAKALRENADYENEFSDESARALVKKAGLFLDKAQKILNS